MSARTTCRHLLRGSWTEACVWGKKKQYLKNKDNESVIPCGHLQAVSHTRSAVVESLLEDNGFYEYLIVLVQFVWVNHQTLLNNYTYDWILVINID